MRLNQFEKKREKINTADVKIEEALIQLEELLRFPNKILLKVRNIEGLSDQPLSKTVDKSIKNIDRNIKRIRDEILKAMEDMS
ncbi:hypothetical protein [Persephonella sp.]